jgi:prepilin-type processing-associated H-X9-DG protein
MGNFSIGGRAANAATDWPPGSQNRTGLGLHWTTSSGTAPPRWDPLDPPSGIPDPSHQPAVRQQMILDPSGTMAMTEMVHNYNGAGHATYAIIAAANAHVQPGNGVTDANYHNGRFNYLQVDAHVELLPPSKTLGTATNLAQQSGMWTILAGD